MFALRCLAEPARSPDASTAPSSISKTKAPSKEPGKCFACSFFLFLFCFYFFNIMIHDLFITFMIIFS